MVMWNEFDINEIEISQMTKDKLKYNLNSDPLRFQIPRGMCTWGVSAYKSFNLELSNQEFINWWKKLENILCNNDNFTSNMNNDSLRIKIDESTYIFDNEKMQVSPEIKEGLFSGHELTCMVEIRSNYFYNGVYGLTVRASQVRYYTPVLKGVCAFN